MTKILGLDLGTNSIGWAVVDKEKQKILDSGVRIFPESIENLGEGENEKSKNAKRREHRQSRRHFFRKRLRKIKLLEILINENMCPLVHEDLKKWMQWNKSEKSDGKKFPSSPDFVNWLKMNPYQLRDKALKETINLMEFGRILYHLIQRRGFLSTRKGKDDGKIYQGKENMSGIEETQDKLRDDTLGSYLYSVSHKEGEEYHPKKDINGKEIRVRARYTLREMYIREFYEIWKRQSENLKLNELQVKINKVLFIYGDPNNKENIKKITHIVDSKGKDNVHVEGNKIIISETKSLFEILAGKIWEEDGQLRYKSNESILFWQRPLRSQKNLLVKCLFERDIKTKDGKWIQKGKTPCPLSHPFFELFRAYQFINNIAYENDITLNDYQRAKIIDLFNSKDKLDFKEIPKTLGLSDEKFNYEDDYKIPGNPTIKQLRKLFPAEIWEKNMNEIWHCFYFYNDDYKLFDKLKNSYQLLSDDIEKIKNIKLAFGYCSVSLKAILNILPYLEKGYKYPFAVILGGVKNAFGQRWEYFRNYHEKIENSIRKIIREKNKEGVTIEKIKEYLLDPVNQFGFSKNNIAFKKLYHHSQDIEIKNKSKVLSPIENLRNPIVQQGLNELRKVVNSLLQKYREEYGADFYFDRINIELARELRSSKKQREEQIWLINQNTKKNDEARERLAEFGLKPSRENVHKYLLFKEIETRNGRVQCPYTGKTISVFDLLGPENKIQIEHIIPFSISLNDSQANKTLCEANFNREKGERTPYQFYAKNPDPSLWGSYSWEEIEQRAYRLLPFNKAKKFTLKNDFKLDDFVERQLNDSRYISKKAAEVLREICDDVRVMPGQLTADLRHLWGLNNIIQPVICLNLENIRIDESKPVPHLLLLNNLGEPTEIYPILNNKPLPGENETIITGMIKNNVFTSAEHLKINIDAPRLKDGKYWAKLKISVPVSIQQVFADRPPGDENQIIFRGRVEKGFFINDSLNKKIRVNYPDGMYWVKFQVIKKEFSIPDGKNRPEAGKNHAIFFGEVKNYIFNSFIYSCNTNLQDGKYWIKLEIEIDNPELIRAVNEKPQPNQNQLVINGTVDDSGEFTSDIDIYHKLKLELKPGKYWILFDIENEGVDFYPIEREVPEKLKDQEIVEGNIWVDEKTGEIRFDPKKNRNDHRHHAIDAITIAVTELSYLQKLSFHNAHRKDWERGISDRPYFEPPWINFELDVKRVIDNILVSYRQNNKILNKTIIAIVKNGNKYKSSGYSACGQLHRETYYGSHPGKTKDGSFEMNKNGNIVYYYHIRKPVSEIKTHKHVEKIVDDGIRNLILNKLRDEGIDTGKPYEIPKNFFFDANKQPILFLPNKRGEPVPVKKIRMREFKGNAVQLKSNLNQWVDPYNNHHVLIYKDNSGELKEQVVPFWTVVERKQQGITVYQLPDDGREIVEVLHENDMFILGLSEDETEEIDFNDPDYSYLCEYLYRVQKISSMYYTFRHHLASTLDNENEEIRIVSFNAWLRYNPKKVNIDMLGRMELFKRNSVNIYL